MISRELTKTQIDETKPCSDIVIINNCINKSAEESTIDSNDNDVKKEFTVTGIKRNEHERAIDRQCHQNISSVHDNSTQEKERHYCEYNGDGSDRSNSIIANSSNGSSSSSSNDSHNGGVWERAVPALSSGAVQAVLFNPIDRALYLRVTFRRSSFLDWRNFDRPFQGFMNAAVYRTLVGACYLFWQDTFNLYIQRHLPSWCQEDVSPQLNAMLIGFTAGASNGLALNALQAIKFRMWNENLKDVSFWKTARLMHAEAGWRIFLRGSLTTVVRDSTFGIIYEITRRSTFLYNTFNYLLADSSTDTKLISMNAHKTEEFENNLRNKSQLEEVSPLTHNDNQIAHSEHTETSEWEQSPSLSASLPTAKSDITRTTTTDNSSILSCHPVSRFGVSAFIVNLIAAMTASILSSPLNYVRNIIYGTPHSAVPLGYWVLLRSFYTQFIYILTHGESYVVRHGSGELAERERIKNVKTKPHSFATSSSPSSSSSSSSSSSYSYSLHNEGGAKREQINVHTNRFCSNQACKLVERENVSDFTLKSIRRWLSPHKYYVKAAWRWSNSRLNVGWGSIRVGVGMALSQSCFYIIQDWFNGNCVKSVKVN